VCFVVLILTENISTKPVHPPAGAAASPAFIKKGFVIRAGIIASFLAVLLAMHLLAD
jgi:hypothetical protein